MSTTAVAATAVQRPMRGAGRRPAREDLLWCLLLAALAMTISAIGVVNAPALSALDEHTHLDYAWQVRGGEIPHQGSELAPETLVEWSCRGQAGFTYRLPSCEAATGGDVGAADYPARGENYNEWHPPLYYAVTALVAGTAQQLGMGFTDAARLSGGLWLAAAVVAMYAVLRIWRLPRWWAACGSATLLAIPTLTHAASTVTNDAPGALIGVGALWILTRVFLQHRTGWVLPTVLAVLAAATKLMSTVGILAAVGVVALTAVPALRERRTAEGLRRIAVALGPVVGIFTVAVAWSAFQFGRGATRWTTPLEGVSTVDVVGNPLDEWGLTLMSAFGLVGDFYLQPPLHSVALATVVTGLQVLLTAAPFMSLALFGPGRAERAPAWAALLGAIAVPLLVQIQELVQGGGYYPHVSNRYALTLIPLTLACLALAAHERRWRAVSIAVPVGGVLVMLLSFTGVF